MQRALGSVLLTLALGGCGGDDANEPVPVEVAGTWSGSSGSGAEEATIAFTLSEAAGVVQGSGLLSSGENFVNIDVEGTYEEPEVALTMTADGFEPIGFVGTVTETLMEGHLNGSGFFNEEITFTRRE